MERVVTVLIIKKQCNPSLNSLRLFVLVFVCVVLRRGPPECPAPQSHSACVLSISWVRPYLLPQETYQNVPNYLSHTLHVAGLSHTRHVTSLHKKSMGDTLHVFLFIIWQEIVTGDRYLHSSLFRRYSLLVTVMYKQEKYCNKMKYLILNCCLEKGLLLNGRLQKYCKHSSRVSPAGEAW